MIPWIIVAAVAGLILGTAFAERIREWAINVAANIFEAIDKTVQIVSDGIVSIIKQGTTYYKQMKVYVKERKKPKDEYSVKEVTRKIDPSEIPQDIKEDMKRKEEKKEILRMKA
ncbi:MAG: hypothetical protein QNJ38_17970 [Prochloraceae cyanobacterium]|nr:hypothetical protein [Prochloraceae cyanobacterium]